MCQSPSITFLSLYSKTGPDTLGDSEKVLPGVQGVMGAHSKGTEVSNVLL